MQSKLLVSPQHRQGLTRVGYGIVHELVVSWAFIRYDASSTIMPALIFMIAALISLPAAPPHPGLIVVQGFLYFWLYIYSFNLSNQIAGVEEDRRNKPDRPLVQGMVSLQGAFIRWIVVMGLFTLLGFCFGVVAWAILWQVVATLYNFGGWGARWYTKNLVMSLGVIAQLAAAWQLVTPLTPQAWAWILLIAAVVFPLITAQDLRDIDGDRHIGRRTLPLVIGAPASRLLLGVSFLLLPLVVYLAVLWPVGSGSGLPSLLAELVQVAFGITLAVRFLFLRTPCADHRSYMLFTYWYCATLASAIVVMM